MSDIIVIGGGIAGISAAAALSADAEVTVLEAESALGYHASGRSAALFEEAYGAVPVRALNRVSAARHAALDVLSPRGLLMIGTSADNAGFEADLTHMGLEEIEIGAARQMVPILAADVTRAGYHAAAQDIDTDKLIQTYARQVRAAGGRVMTGAGVNKIQRTNGRWRVDAGGATFEAATLVNAAGAWADRIAAMAGVPPLGLTPLRRSIARLPAPGGHDVTGWPILFGPGETWYAKPDAGALLVSPAEEAPSEPMDAYADDMTIAEGLARYEAHVTEPVTRVLTTWAGLRTFSPDRVLVLGRDVDQRDFVWVAGQGGYGFQSAPGAAAFVADHVNGRPSELDDAMVAALLPDRFS